MKTVLNFYHLSYRLALVIPVLIIGLISCDTEIIERGSYTSSEPTIVDHYIGTYEMAHDDCQADHYSIEISPVIPDISYAPIKASKIYISNLMNSGRTILEAEWDGAAFILENQHFTEGNNTVVLSGRLYQSESELTVKYTLSGKEKAHTCSAVFTRKF
jgi:hypothetical protein